MLCQAALSRVILCACAILCCAGCASPAPLTCCTTASPPTTYHRTNYRCEHVTQLHMSCMLSAVPFCRQLPMCASRLSQLKPQVQYCGHIMFLDHEGRNIFVHTLLLRFMPCRLRLL